MKRIFTFTFFVSIMLTTILFPACRHSFSTLKPDIKMSNLPQQPTLDQYLQKIDATVEAAVSPNMIWDGPTSGPPALPNKKIIFVASDLRNGGVLGVSQGVNEAAKIINWEVQTIDGQGTVAGQEVALSEAIALQPDGIILGGTDAHSHKNQLAFAHERGIEIIGWHAAANPGPINDMSIFANITTDPIDVAEIAAQFAIAHSRGKANVVIFTDSNFDIAITKSDTMAQVIEQCITCSVLSIQDIALNKTAVEIPLIITQLLEQYEERWTYSLGINDLYFDFAQAAFFAAGKPSVGPPFNLSAGDGSPSAYQRIRENNFQVGTVPEPLNLHGWQLIDELNRAFSGEEWSGYIAPVHLIISDNIDHDGGTNNVYDPENGYRDAYTTIWLQPHIHNQ